MPELGEGERELIAYIQVTQFLLLKIFLLWHLLLRAELPSFALQVCGCGQQGLLLIVAARGSHCRSLSCCREQL